MRKVLKTNDSAWLFAESDKTPMQVGMLATFRVPEDQPTFVGDLVARWREHKVFAPPFNYLLKSRPLPGWVELEPDDIDLDYHLRHSALPAPGSQRELGVLISRLHSWKMDRRYPLWECHVIEGLEKDRWSLYLKAHHSQVDGVGGIRLLRRILSADPDARDMLPPWSVGTQGPDQSGLPASKPKPKKAVERIEVASRGRVSGAVSRVSDGAKTTRAVSGSLARTYAESVGFGGEDGRAAPYQAPKTIFNGRIHTPRRFATQHYSIDRMKAIAKAGNGTLNDVFMTVTGGAVRRYLKEHDALPYEDLVVNVPVSVRAAGTLNVGNAITFLYANLGTLIDDPVKRMKAIKKSTQMGKDRMPKVGPGAMDAYTAVLMAPFLSQAILGFGGRGRPAANLVISNVPGPAETRYLDGSVLEELYPVSLLFNGQALNVTAVSYDGQFNIGFTGCRDSIPSLQKIAVYAGEELARLEEGLGLSTPD